jgi:hypothetical protein
MGTVLQFRRRPPAPTVGINLPLLSVFGSPFIGDQRHECGSLYVRWRLTCDRLGTDRAAALILRQIPDLTSSEPLEDYCVFARQLAAYGKMLAFLPRRWNEQPHGENILFYVVGVSDQESIVGGLIRDLHSVLP